MRASCVSVAAVALLIALTCGCGHTLHVRAQVIEPAGIPVRAFPVVWVERGQLPAEEELVRAFVSYLGQTPGIEARVVSSEEISAARAGGTLRPATVVVTLRLRTRELSRVEWTTRPETNCDAIGCFTSQRSYDYDVPILLGELTVVITDAQTSNELQRAVIGAREERGEFDGMLSRVVATLSARLSEITEQRVVPVDVTLLEVDQASVQAALRMAEQGDWEHARERLEAALVAGEFDSLAPDQRARVFYDLAQMRRFATRDGQGRLAALAEAGRALERASANDPQPIYTEALAEVVADIRRRGMVEDQRAATEQNFALDRSAPATTTAATTDALPGTP